MSKTMYISNLANEPIYSSYKGITMSELFQIDQVRE